MWFWGAGGGQSGWGIKLTTHHHLVPRLRMSEAIYLLTHMPSWHGKGKLYILFPSADLLELHMDSTVIVPVSKIFHKVRCLQFGKCLIQNIIKSPSLQCHHEFWGNQSHGSKSGEYGGCKMSHFVLSHKVTHKVVWTGAMSWCRNQYCKFHISGHLSFKTLSTDQNTVPTT